MASNLLLGINHPQEAAFRWEHSAHGGAEAPLEQYVGTTERVHCGHVSTPSPTITKEEQHAQEPREHRPSMQFDINAADSEKMIFNSCSAMRHHKQEMQKLLLGDAHSSEKVSLNTKFSLSHAALVTRRTCHTVQRTASWPPMTTHQRHCWQRGCLIVS